MKAGVIIFLILIALAVGFYFFRNQFSSSEPLNQVTDYILIESPKPVEFEKSSSSDSALIHEPRYMDHAPRGYISPNDNTLKKRVYFFYADWCPTCRPVDAELKANLSKIPEDVMIIKVNYNDQYTDDLEIDLARQYGVTYQHSFVQIDERAEIVNKWNGGGLDNLISKLK